MRRLFAPLAAALLAFALAASPSWAGEAPRLQRATLTVSDLERSLAFYRDLLGFTVRATMAYETPALRTMFASSRPDTPLST